MLFFVVNWIYLLCRAQK